ncbi:MAG: hypothetical protein ACYS8Z_11715 [Planctomycetota bacterium]
MAEQCSENIGDIMHRAMSEMKNWAVLTGILTVVFELVTIVIRLVIGGSAEQYIEQNDPHILIQIHHMFWAVPFLIAGAVCIKRTRARRVLLSISLALILSDLAHHFLVLPLWTGSTGWHWP